VKILTSVYQMTIIDNPLFYSTFFGGYNVSENGDMSGSKFKRVVVFYLCVLNKISSVLKWV